ncbi:MAG: sugar ABC transporter substrate-binding protein [Anaerolineae bacterium]
MKKKFVFSGIVVIFCYLLTACAGPSPSAKPVTITFYKRGYIEGGTDTTSVTNAKAIEVFQKNHPNITVKIVGIPWTLEGTAQLEAALADGTDINVFSIDHPNLAYYARQGKLSNLEPYLTEEDRADFYASGLQAVTVDGKISAWPIWVVTVGIYANTDLFEERGVALPTLDNPWSWDEFVAAAQKLTFKRANGTQVYGFSVSSLPGEMAWQPFWYIDGGRVLSPDGRRFVQNTPEGLSALQKAADLALVYNVTPPDFGNVTKATVHDQFKQGAVAMMMDSPGFITDLERENFPFTILPPPVGELGKVVTAGFFGMYGVYNTSDPDKLKAAHELARYLTGSQVAQDVPNYQQSPGLRRSNTAYATSPNRAIMAQLVGYVVYEPPANVSPDLINTYELTMQSILLGKKTPQQAMDEIAPLYQQELDATSQ